MKYTYTEFLDILDWELQQEKQGGDSAAANKFRFLPHTQSLRVINETIRELATISPDQFEREYTYFAFTQLSTQVQKYLRLPDFIVKVLAYWNSTDEVWSVLGDSSDLDSDVVSIDSDTIYCSDGLSSGDSVKLKVVAFPHEVVDGAAATASFTFESITGNKIVTENVEFPSDTYYPEGSLISYGTDSPSRYVIDRKDDASNTLYLNKDVNEYSQDFFLISPSTYIPLKDPYIRLLILEIKRKVYARKGKALASFDYSELMTLKQQWREETSPIQHKARIAFEGYGLGR